MKQLSTTILLVLCFVSFDLFAQSSDKKNYFAIGGGKESYNGDLGNSWFKPEEEWYGFISAQYGRYLNKSFDISVSMTHGDYGHCREEGESEFRPDGTERLNMLSRLTTGIISVKYKFGNGYLLQENAKLAPYVYVGGGISNLSNSWWENKNRVNPGNSLSINGGLGLSYNFCKNYSFTYNLGSGYFTTDNFDKRSEGINDMYLQHTLLLGVRF
jgi:hypothetical protein